MSDRIARIALIAAACLATVARAEPLVTPGADSTLAGWPDPSAPADTLALTPHLASAVERPGLARRDDPSIARVIENANGIRSRGAADRLAPPIVRGMGGDRVVVMESFFPVEDFRSLGVDGPLLDARTAARVDVTRGPRGGRLEPSALGGVIRVTPRALEFGSRGDGVVRAGGEGYAGTGGRGAGAAFDLDGARGAYAWRFGGGARGAPDLSAPSGTIDRTGFRSADGEVVLGARGDEGRTELRLARSSGTFDLPLPLDVAPGMRREIDDRRVQWLGAYAFAPWVLEARGQWQRRTLATTTDGDARPPLDLRLDAYRLELTGQYDRERWGVTLGASGLASQVTSRAELAPIPDARIVSGAVFALGRLGGAGETPPWSVRADGRVDLSHLEAEDDPDLALATQTRTWNLGSGAVEAAYRLAHGLTASLGIGSAWRAPTLIELYAHGPALDRARYRLGGRDLAAERGLGLDGALAWRSRRARASASGFAQRVDDFVAFDSTGEVRDGLQVERPRARPAVFFGGELSAEVETFSMLSLLGRIDHARGQDRDTEQPVDGVPPSRWLVAADLHRRVGGAGGAASIRLELEGQLRASRPGPSETAVPAYLLAHLELAVRVPSGAGTVRVGARIENLADARYRDLFPPDPARADGPGRGVVLRVSSEP